MINEELEFSGERYVTSLHNDNTIEHLHRYALALEFVKDKVVLDLACGEGYGSSLMSELAKEVIGIDNSQSTINHAKAKYQRDNLYFICANAVNTTLSTHSVDAVISFETIEHLIEQEEMLVEVIRVLKPDGLLIISSPDKKYYSDLTGHKNPFHLKELYFAEFKHLLKIHFTNCTFLLQRVTYGSIINVESSTADLKFYTGNVIKVERCDTLASPVYNIAVCSNREIPQVCNSFFEDLSIINNAFKDITQALNALKNSGTFRIGKVILAPKRFLYRLFKKA